MVSAIIYGGGGGGGGRGAGSGTWELGTRLPLFLMMRHFRRFVTDNNMYNGLVGLDLGMSLMQNVGGLR